MRARERRSELRALSVVLAIRKLSIDRCCGTMPAHSSGVCVLVVLLLLLVDVVSAKCPVCHGNYAGCNFATTGTCIAVTMVAANAQTIVKKTGSLNLANIIPARLLRVFARTTLNSLVTLASRPAPGTPFVIDKDTKNTAIEVAIMSHQIEKATALTTLGELIEDCGDDDAGKALREKLVHRVQYLKLVNPPDECVDAADSRLEFGIYTFVLAKCCEFVSKGTGLRQVIISAKGLGTSGSQSTAYSATLVRPTSMERCGEALNLFLMFIVSLGISGGLIVAQFIQFAFYDIIHYHHKSWQFAFELMVCLLRKVEDSDGKFNLGSVTDEAFLNTVWTEAEANVKAFFRTHGGNPESENKDDDEKKPIVWNKKFTSSASRPCVCYNTGTVHGKTKLFGDGTCKYNHVCDAYLEGGGQCLNSAGTPGHTRKNCDHPKRKKGE